MSRAYDIGAGEGPGLGKRRSKREVGAGTGQVGSWVIKRDHVRSGARRKRGSLRFHLLFLTEVTTPMPSPSPSPSSLQPPPDQTSKHLLKPDRNLARALSTGQWG